MVGDVFLFTRIVIFFYEFDLNIYKKSSSVSIYLVNLWLLLQNVAMGMEPMKCEMPKQNACIYNFELPLTTPNSMSSKYTKIQTRGFLLCLFVYNIFIYA